MRIAAETVLQTKRQLEGRLQEGERNVRPRWKYDWERSRKAIQTDYLGPSPIFDDKQFERVFRVTRGLAELLALELGNSNDFFTQRRDVSGRLGICPKVKILMGLKQLAYGCSPAAFQAYFQMGETTGRLCLTEMCRSIAGSAELRAVFLRSYSRDDARRVTKMHHEQHGAPGLLGSLDCMHVGWRLCPFAWQGAYSGAKGKPTIILEAVIDYNLWFWHANFGAPGTHNDINVLDRSPLLEAFLDGSYAELDYKYELGSHVMNELYILVDEIYLEISRFCKTYQEPNTELKKKYAGWQEA